MNQANLQNEPTMDEILASIRKIISEDQGEPEEKKAAELSVDEPEPVNQAAIAPLAPSASSSADEAPAEPIEAPPAESFDVSKLAAEMAADEPAPMPSAAELSIESIDEASLDEVVSSETAGYGDLAPEEALPEEYIVESTAEDGLLSDSARSAFDAALGQIDADDEPVRTEIAQGDSVEAVFARAIQQAFEPTLQDWVDDNRADIFRSLTPLIREWMDENLPPLIEAAVAKEISRAVRARRR